LNWRVYVTGLTVGMIVWMRTGDFFIAAIVSIIVRVILGVTVGARWK